MIQIKQLQPKEGVTLVTVKVPEGATRFQYSDGIFISMNDLGKPLQRVDFPDIKMKVKILGKATEIPEEVWQGIVSKVIVNGDTYFGYIDGNRELHTFNLATESAMSFLSENDIDPNSIILMKQND